MRSAQRVAVRDRGRQPGRFALPQLDAGLERRHVPDIRAALEAIVRELYERTERTREPATIITRPAADRPDLFKLFFIQVRRDLIGRLTRNVESRIDQGEFPAGLDAAAAGRFVLETVTTFARHCHADSDPRPLGDAAVRETVVRLIVRGLVLDQRGT